jgi:hypothetical protein
VSALEKAEFLIIITLTALAGLRFPLPSKLLGRKDSWRRKHLRLLWIAAWLVAALLFVVCFRESEAVWEYFAAIVEVAGVAILGREVWFAQHMEHWRDSISLKKQAIAVLTCPQNPFIRA